MCIALVTASSQPLNSIEELESYSSCKWPAQVERETQVHFSSEGWYMLVQSCPLITLTNLQGLKLLAELPGVVRTFTALNADTVATDLDKSLLRWTSAQKCRLRMATGMTQQISREIWASASARTPFLAEKWPRSPRRSLRSCSGACVLAMDLWFELHYQQILSPYSMAASVQHPVCQTPPQLST